jgi:hypothetical protein
MASEPRENNSTVHWLRVGRGHYGEECTEHPKQSHAGTIISNVKMKWPTGVGSSIWSGCRYVLASAPAANSQCGQ